MNCGYCLIELKEKTKKFCGQGCRSEFGNKKVREENRKDFWDSYDKGIQRPTGYFQNYMGTFRRDF